MIKEDITKEIIRSLSLKRDDGKRVTEELIKLMLETLENKDNLMISGFGQFKVRHKKARQGRNPKNNKPYEISERNVITFQTSKVFREALNS